MEDHLAINNLPSQLPSQLSHNQPSPPIGHLTPHKNDNLSQPSHNLPSHNDDGKDDQKKKEEEEKEEEKREK